MLFTKISWLEFQFEIKMVFSKILRVVWGIFIRNLDFYYLIFYSTERSKISLPPRRYYPVVLLCYRRATNALDLNIFVTENIVKLDCNLWNYMTLIYTKPYRWNPSSISIFFCLLSFDITNFMAKLISLCILLNIGWAFDWCKHKYWSNMKKYITLYRVYSNEMVHNRKYRGKYLFWKVVSS